MSSHTTSIAEDFDNAMDNAIREYERKTELALAEAARLEQVISAEKAAREAAEIEAGKEKAHRQALEAQLAELLKKLQNTESNE